MGRARSCRVNRPLRRQIYWSKCSPSTASSTRPTASASPLSRARRRIDRLEGPPRSHVSYRLVNARSSSGTRTQLEGLSHYARTGALLIELTNRIDVYPVGNVPSSVKKPRLADSLAVPPSPQASQDTANSAFFLSQAASHDYGVPPGVSFNVPLSTSVALIIAYRLPMLCCRRKNTSLTAHSTPYARA